MKEYGELEKQMKKTLIDIEKREKQLSINEQEVRNQQDCHRSFSSRIDSTNANRSQT